MNIGLVARLLGYMAFAVGAMFLPSVIWALIYHEWKMIPGILIATALAWGVGFALYLAGRNASERFMQREALCVVVFSWLLAGFLGAFPFILTGTITGVHAFFESFSGFTTTGSTILDDIESLPRSILFWRSLTHWLGGIGIVVMFLAVLPTLGAGGKQLMKSEASGPNPKILRPRVRETAKTLFAIYLTLTIIQTIALRLTGKMDVFDALCHTFATLATGGFSTKNLSIAAFDSIAVEIICIVFMIAGGTSFALYFAIMGRRWRMALSDAEWRLYLAILFITIMLVTFNVAGLLGGAPLGGNGDLDEMPALGSSFRGAVFTVTSIQTNTGFVTVDSDAWPFFSRMTLVVIMCIGGSAGSTSGGIKVVRFMALLKMLYHRIEHTFSPKLVRAVRVGDDVMSAETQREVLTFVGAYALTLGGFSLLMSLWGLPFESALSAVAACMSNTGPGLELVGAKESFAIIPNGGLLTLMVCMVLGRLELFTLFTLLTPGFWRYR